MTDFLIPALIVLGGLGVLVTAMGAYLVWYLHRYGEDGKPRGR